MRRAALLALLISLAALPDEGYAQRGVVRPAELNVQYHRAEAAWRSGTSLLEAKTRIDRVLRELPDDFEARKLRAQVLLALDRPTEALADAERAAALQSGDGEAYVLLCEAARRSGDERRARRALEAAAARPLEGVEVHVRLSRNAAALGELDMAESFARVAQALDATDADASLQLARVFVQRGQPDDAAGVLASALSRRIIGPAAIRRDSALAPLARNARVSPYLP